MRYFQPLADPHAPLARRNATAKLAAAMLLTVGLLLSPSLRTALVGIGLELLLVPLAGIRYGMLLRRGWPVLISAAGVLVFNLMFSTVRSGEILLDAGPLVVTEDGFVSALGYALRLIAVSLPGLLIAATIDPTDLADSLVAHARVPARFAIGTLAAFRLVPLLVEERAMLTMARRARGVDAGANPVARIRLFSLTLFALLVAAIRRGTRLATAMDARGFDSANPRTIARPQYFGPADALLIAGAGGLAVLAHAAGAL